MALEDTGNQRRPSSVRTRARAVTSVQAPGTKAVSNGCWPHQGSPQAWQAWLASDTVIQHSTSVSRLLERNVSTLYDLAVVLAASLAARRRVDVLTSSIKSHDPSSIHFDPSASRSRNLDQPP